MKRVLIIGAYGNFGRFITGRLAQDKSLKVVIAGRSQQKADELAEELVAQKVSVHQPEAHALDIHVNLQNRLAQLNPDIVIHTSGPFQSQDYKVAEACIEVGAHYIDLADGREFVSEIYQLDLAAKKAGVVVISGASSVPCLTSALIDHYQQEFAVIEEVDYGITTAQKTTRGLATTAAILSYTGKGFDTKIDGTNRSIFGWQSLRARKYRKLGWRMLGNCNVPDLALFPARYPDIRTIRFYAGLELPFIHIVLWSLSWLVRTGLISSLEKAAPLLLKLSFLFDWMGTVNSGFHMRLSGKDELGKPKVVDFELTAKSGDGPYIPCMPAILMCQKLADGQFENTGASPCIGMISKSEYLTALENLDICWGEK